MAEKQKTAIVTGAASGIGFAAANLLADLGIKVIGIARNEKRCQEAKEKTGEVIEFLPCDLSSGRSLRLFAEKIRCQQKQIDMLIHCAGMQQSHYMTSEDGIEMQFAVNHLAPFVLTYELLPCLKASEDARIIVITSMAHRHVRLNFNDLQHQKHYTGFRQYKCTKLMNLLFAVEFNRRVKGLPMRAIAIDPGVVNTEFGSKGMSGLEGYFCRLFLKHGVQPEVPAKCIAYATTSDEVLKTDAIFYKDFEIRKPDPYVYNEEAARLLWKESERFGMTGAWSI